MAFSAKSPSAVLKFGRPPSAARANRAGSRQRSANVSSKHRAGRNWHLLLGDWLVTAASVIEDRRFIGKLPFFYPVVTILDLQSLNRRGATGEITLRPRFRFLYLTTPAYDKSTIICRAEFPPRLQQRRFELEKCAQQLVRRRCSGDLRDGRQQSNASRLGYRRCNSPMTSRRRAKLVSDHFPVFHVTSLSRS